jgi:hypothetical protein
MKYAVGSVALALLLAGCGGSNADADGDGKISVKEAAAEIERKGGAMKPKPGQYKGTTELVSLEMPDSPPEVKQMLEGMMGKEPQVMEFCLTKEEADKGFQSLAEASQNDDCSFEKFDIDGGKIDAKMNCSAKDKSKATITLTGKGSETSSEMTMVMDAKGPDGKTMKMTMKTSQERIGECKGPDAAK